MNEIPSWAFWLRRVALALLGGLLVYVAYFPSDSIMVETGDALWFCMIALLMWTATMASDPFFAPVDRTHPFPGRSFDLLLWLLALWMMAAAFAACPPGNLRMATNEAWLWVAGAATLTAARRLLRQNADRVMLMTLIGAIALGIAGIALHQQWISLPVMRAEYLADPDAFLKSAGEEAPRGTARRMVFANRLLDGGPTGSFALANSLAAMMLAAVIIPLGVLREAFLRHRGKAIVVGLVVLIALAASALVATRSRSALLACLIGAIWLWMPRSSSKSAYNISRVALTGITASFAIVMVGILLLGDIEWIAAAPASLEMRLHYWIATVKLVTSHPILGAGPGGFQAMYLQFRSSVAHETISDPHNFIFETLASGGLVAAVLLVVAGAAARRLARLNQQSNDHNGACGLKNGLPLPGIAIGAVIALVLIWMLSLATMRLPDWQANLFGIPIAIAAFWGIRSATSGPFQVNVQRIASATLMAVLIHLLVSGGWTVPGVAILVWLTVAILCHDGASGPDSDRAFIFDFGLYPRISIGWIVTGLLLMTALRLESIGPVQNSELALARAKDARLRGLEPRTESEIQQAVDADSWALEPARWRSEILREKLVSTSNSRSTAGTSEIRDDWTAAVDEAIRRSPGNPFLLRSIGEQSLHFYQVFGQRADLENARRRIVAATEKNPTDLSLLAQLSLIYFELGDRAKAVSLAQEVKRLSGLGGNIVRDLGLQHAMVVDKIGVTAVRYPVYKSLKVQFAGRAAFSGEPVVETPRNNETEF